ncbi:hypothetical protein A8L34_01140 [Bacillus sp. FJAT-27264]|uniref:hypothetical protein n=1 Tax=Paenibacillus sp. (strain DSM 101736 / FJAT-27264) TaxID=1850362 RepID=UPI000807D901|nr:hypothetical protein [Bacillus sp. FJAT-27264]OBZ18222.1 hypothetical protein A8L34_01140 [Bacillus sp. FJAT-27264]
MNEKERLILARFLFPELTRSVDIEKLLNKADAGARLCRLKYAEAGFTRDVCLLIHKETTWIFCLRAPELSSWELSEPEEVRQACVILLNGSDECESDNQTAPAPAMLLSRTRFEQIQEESASLPVHILSDLLEEASGDVLNAPRLARIMKRCTSKGELRLCMHGSSGWNTQYASYIADPSGAFVLRIGRGTEDWMIAAPTTKAEFCNAVTQWVLKAAPI